MGGQTYEPVRGPWFACPGSRTARRSARPVLEHRPPIPRPPIPRSPIPRSPIPRSLLPWRTVSGCNRRASHCARFVKTWRSSLRPCAVIRAPWQGVIAPGARLVVACYRLPRRIRLIPARVSFSIFSGWPVARVCFRLRVFVIWDHVQWRKGPRHLIPSTIPMTCRDRSENLARVGEGRWLRLCFTKIIP